MQDISSKQDIHSMLESFYDKLLIDEVTRPIFANLNMKEHIPIITKFWAMILLGEMDYKGNPFDKHVSLNLRKEHFDRWLFHFNSTLDDSFEGPIANMAKERAKSIGYIFKSKLGLEQ